MAYSQLQQRHYTPPATSAGAPLLAGGQLRRALLRTTVRYAFGKPAGSLILLAAHEVPQPGRLAEGRVAAELAEQLAQIVRRATGAPFVGHEGGRLCFMLPGDPNIQARLHELARQVAAATFSVEGRAARLSPAIGYAALTLGKTLDDRKGYALAALAQAQLCDDLQPVCYRPPERPRARALVARLGALWRRLNTPLQIASTFLLGIVLPLCAYVALHRAGLDVTPAVYLGTALMLLITSYLIWYEGLFALRVVGPPAEPETPCPPASAIIAAYLPNEAATIIETLGSFLQIAYPGRLELILAYNSPQQLPVEAELRELAAREPRLRLLRVDGSTSKAQNVNAALAVATGAFVGIFDADHHPAADSFARAWGWLSRGYDVVQGHCVIRNGDETWVTRLVAVEFETIYAVAHAGRARVHAFGIFGGSNGYWRTEVLRATRLRASMLTEDIDASLRALIDGRRIAYDPLLISRELAPLTLGALWNQRMRWAQGWFQVSIKHLGPALRSPNLSPRQKFGVFYLLAWREIYPWISLQIASVLAFWVWLVGVSHMEMLIPIFVLTTLLTFSSGPGQVLFAYLLGAPEVRRHWRWYLLYLLSAVLFYSGLKNLISRVAMVKELMREKQWKVTPRETRAGLTRTGAEL